MPDNFVPVGVRFEAKDFNQFRATMRSADRLIGNLNDSIGSMVGSFNSFSSNIRNVLSSSGTLASNIVRGVGEVIEVSAGLAKAGIDIASSFEDSFTSVTKTVKGLAELDSDGFVKLTEAGEELKLSLTGISNATPITFEELSKIAGLGGQLGLVEGLGDPAEAQRVLGSFAQTIAGLAEATDLTQQRAAVDLAQITNIFRQSAGSSIKSGDDLIQNVESLGNTLVELGNTSATTEGRILSFAQRIAGTSQTVGITQADMLGISAAFTSVGLTAEAGGSSVIRTLIAMQKAVAESGEGFVDNTEKIEDYQVKVALLEGQLETIAARTGVTADQVIAQRDAWIEADKSVEDFGSQLGAVERRQIFGIVSKVQDLRGEIDKLEETQGLQIVGEDLKKFADVVGVSADDFKVLFEENPVEAFTQFIEGLGDAGDDAGQILQGLSLGTVQTLRALLNISSASDLLRGRIEASNEAWKEGTALVDEITIRYATLTSRVQRLNNRVRNTVGILFDDFIPVVGSAVDVLGEMIVAIGTGLPGVFGQIGRIGEPIGVALAGFFSFGDPVQAAEDAIDSIVAFLKGVDITDEVNFFKDFFVNFDTQGFDPIIDAVNTFVQDNATEEMAALFDEVSETVENLIEDFELLIGVITTPISNIDFAETAITTIEGVSTALEFLNENWESFRAARVGAGAAIVGAGVVAGVVSLTSAILGLITPINILIASGAALGVAWEQNWLGIQETTEAVVSGLSTSFTFIQELIGDFQSGGGGIENVFDAFQVPAQTQTDVLQFFDNLQTGFQTLVESFQLGGLGSVLANLGVPEQTQTDIFQFFDNLQTEFQTLVNFSETVSNTFKSTFESFQSGGLEGALANLGIPEDFVPSIIEASNTFLEFLSAIPGLAVSAQEQISASLTSMQESAVSTLTILSEAVQSFMLSGGEGLLRFLEIPTGSIEDITDIAETLNPLAIIMEELAEDSSTLASSLVELAESIQELILMVVGIEAVTGAFASFSIPVAALAAIELTGLQNEIAIATDFVDFLREFIDVLTGLGDAAEENTERFSTIGQFFQTIRDTEIPENLAKNLAPIIQALVDLSNITIDLGFVEGVKDILSAMIDLEDAGSLFQSTEEVEAAAGSSFVSFAEDFLLFTSGIVEAVTDLVASNAIETIIELRIALLLFSEAILLVKDGIEAFQAPVVNVEAIEQLQTVFGIFGDFSAQIKEDAATLFETLTSLGPRIQEALASLILGDPIEPVDIGDILGGVPDDLDFEILEPFTNLFSNIDFGTPDLENFREFFTLVRQQLIDGFTNLFGEVDLGFPITASLLDFFLTVRSQLIEGFTDVLADVNLGLNFAGDFLETAKTQITEGFTNIFGDIDLGLPDSEDVIEFFTTVKNQVQELFSNILSDVFIIGDVDTGGFTFGDIFSQFNGEEEGDTIAESVTDGLLDGLIEREEESSDAGLTFAERFVKGFKEFLGIKSPSTLFQGFAKDIIDGLVLGLTELADVNALVDAITLTIQSMFEDMTESVDLFTEETIPFLVNVVVEELIPAKQLLAEINITEVIPSVEQLTFAEETLGSEFESTTRKIETQSDTLIDFKDEAKKLLPELDKLIEAFIDLGKAIDNISDPELTVPGTPSSTPAGSAPFAKGGSFTVPTTIPEILQGPTGGMLLEVHANELVQITSADMVSQLRQIPDALRNQARQIVQQSSASSGAAFPHISNNTTDNSKSQELHLHVKEQVSPNVRDSFNLLRSMAPG